MKKQKFNATDYHIHPALLPRERYWTTSHLNPKRFFSIGYQWKIAVESNNRTFLEIGIGSGLLSYLLSQKGLSAWSLDINHSLDPSMVGDLYELPLVDKAIECVLCYQTLEHMPFETLPLALKEFRRVAKKHVIISLPDIEPVNTLEKNLFVLRKNIREYLQPERGEEIHPAHRWEIGYKKIDTTAVIATARSIGLTLVQHFRPAEHDWHHFFIFKV